MAVFCDDTERRLLANDPTLTSLSLRSSDVVHLHNYSYRVGQALDRSMHLTHLDLEANLFRDDIPHLGNGEASDNTSLHQVMKYVMLRPSLESLRFHSSGFDEYTAQASVAAGLVQRALNTRIEEGLEAVKSVSFACLVLGAESMVDLLQKDGVQECTLDCCLFLPGSFAVAWAFNANVALVCALLEEDDYKGEIDGLVLWNHGDENVGLMVAAALPRFLRSSPGLVKMLSLHDFFWTGQSFAPIAETVSTAQTRLNLGGGSMDSDACALLRSMYLPEGEAKMLSLSLDIQFPDTNEYQILTDLIGSTPGLTAFTLRINDSNTAVDRQQFVATMGGLKSTSCAIQTLGLYGSASSSLFEVFTNTLPQFCSVEKLVMERPPDRWNEELMEGFRKNRSLKEVSIDGLHASDRTRLDVYLQRNKELPTVIQLEALALSSQSSTPAESAGTAASSNISVTTTTPSTTTTGKLSPPLFQATGTGTADDDSTVSAPSTTVVVSTTKGKLLPALLVSSLDPVVTAIGVSHLVGGLVGGGQSIGQHRTGSGKRILQSGESA